IGEEGQRKLARARVLLVGCGGLGAPIATYLTAAGVGTLGLMDDDVVSLTNLHRQVLFTEGQVGLGKVACAALRLRLLNSGVVIREHPCRLSPDNADGIISEYDIVADGTDNAASRYLISDVCQRLGKPYVYGSIRGLEGQVAVLCKGRATYRTLFPDGDAKLPADKHVLGVTPAVVGSVEASQVIQLICGYGEPLADRLWTIDLRTMQSFTINL
ncbi:MAG: HesA/MoeB/ThiF family protein, partial [Prevotellaceae bacterium]|nr:HesA/MoeB/ThiF family protein [Prevotellaceae bacterium]